jgi:hypothetical protein
MQHPDFPEFTYGYVAFRVDNPKEDRFGGKRIYSTPLHGLEEMHERYATMSGSKRVKSPLLVASFELVTVEEWDFKHDQS